jgi:monoamine oxidase
MDGEVPYFEAIVVGGGFAGVTAARDLARERSTLLVEARDRLGGRAWTRSFAGTSTQVELGGQFVYPQLQPHLAGEMERYDIALEPGLPFGRQEWLVGGERREGALPVPFGHLPDFERAAFHIHRAARRIEAGTPLDQQPLADLDVPWGDFLAQLDLPATVHGFFNHVLGVYVGRYPHEGSALHMLNHYAQFGGSVLQATPWARGSRLAGGSGPLIRAIWEDAAANGARAELSAPVAAIRHDSERATVTTQDGRSFAAGAVVLATPLSCWGDVDVTPALHPAKLAAAATRPGAAAGKYWALVEGAPERHFVVADPPTSRGGYQTSVHTVLPEGQLFAGFTVDADAMGIGTLEGVQAAVEMFSPGARVLAFDGHDWIRDPYAKGAWSGFKPGTLSRSHSELARPEGRLAFAGSDVSLGYNGWFDGAIESGRRAARQALRALARA